MPFPIAYLAGSFPLRSETFVWREVRGLRERGWEVHPFGLRAPGDVPAELADLRSETLDVYALPGWSRPLAEELVRPRAWRAWGGGLLDAAFPGEQMTSRNRAKVLAQAQAGVALARVLRERGVRHIHAHFAHAPATVAMFAAKRLGITFSFTGHANDLFQRRHLLRRKLERAAFVGCISEWHREFYRRIVRNGRYEMVRCGVEIDQYSVARRPVRADSIFRILTVARLVEKKGIDTLLRAAAVMPDCHVTIAGDGPERAVLERIAAEPNLAGRVTFLGAVPNAQVAQLLSEADVFALPCRPARDGDQDGIPVVLMEAIAAGVPAVAGDLPAIRELVRDEETGLLVDGTRAADVARAVQRLRDDPSLCHRLAAAGSRRVREEFTLDVNLERLERHLHRAATAGSPIPRSRTHTMAAARG